MKDKLAISLKIVRIRKEVSDLRLGLSLALNSGDDTLGKLMIENISTRRIVLKALERMRTH